MKKIIDSVKDLCVSSGLPEETVSIHDGIYCVFIRDSRDLVDFSLYYDKGDNKWRMYHAEYNVDVVLTDWEAGALASNFINDEGAQMAEDLACEACCW